MGTERGKGEALRYLFGAAQEWRQEAKASKGHLSAVGLTVRLLMSQHAGGRGPNVEHVLPDYGKTMTVHDNGASKYHTETMVKAACISDFIIRKHPSGSGTGNNGGQFSP